MNEKIITFETAKMLKNKMFMVPCIHGYDYNGRLHSSMDYTGEPFFTVSDMANAKDNTGQDHYLAPSLPFVQTWLREEHNIYVVPSPERPTHDDFIYSFQFYVYDDRGIILHDGVGFDSWEDALERGVQEAFKTI